MSVAETVRAAGGFATTRQLRAARHTERAMTRAVRTGQVVRARNGLYSTRPDDDPELRAARLGGRLTGLSAVEALHGWVWTPPRVVHIALRPGSAGPRLPLQPGERIHWNSDDEPGGSPAVVGLRSALVRVVLDEPAEVAVPCVDWALQTGRLDRIDLERVLLRLPRGARGIRRLIDRRSQSVLESVARVRLVSQGWRVRSQARVGELGSIDLVIEDHVALELDGREFHEAGFEADRLKDLRITIEGRHSIRLSNRLVRERWPDVERAIRAALAARRAGDAGKSGTAIPTPRGSRRHRPPAGRSA